MAKLRKIQDAVREPLSPVEWKLPETGAKPYPLPDQFLPVLDFSPPSSGVVVIDPAWLKDPRWMQRNQARVGKLFAEGRVRLEGDPFKWQGRNES